MKVTEEIKDWYKENKVKIIAIGTGIVALCIGVRFGSSTTRLAITNRVHLANEKGITKFFDPNTKSEITNWNEIVNLFNTFDKD